MTSGGARARSGPAPDPNALRRDRAGDAAWTTLPAEGHTGVIPEFPLAANAAYIVLKGEAPYLDEATTARRREDELELWATLWRKPQAAMWAKLHLEYEVAAYVRGYLESVGPDSNAGLKTAALRMAAEIGLSLPGMHALRWKFAADELAEKRDAAESARTTTGSARERLEALGGTR